MKYSDYDYMLELIDFTFCNQLASTLWFSLAAEAWSF